MGETVVRTAGLPKDYGRQRGIVDLDLEIASGEVFGYLGPNGAGKTTTIRLLLDYLRPTRGSATLFDLDGHRDSRAIVRRVGYLPGELHLYDSLSGRELLLANPIPRWRVVFEKFVAMVVEVVVAVAGIWIALALTGRVAGIDLALDRVGAALVSAGLLGLLIGAIAMSKASWRSASCLRTTTTYDPLANGLDAGHSVLLLIATAVMLGVAVLAFERRDLRA